MGRGGVILRRAVDASPNAPVERNGSISLWPTLVTGRAAGAPARRRRAPAERYGNTRPSEARRKRRARCAAAEDGVWGADDPRRDATRGALACPNPPAWMPKSRSMDRFMIQS